MAGDIRLPIKIVVPREEDIRRPEHSGGGDAKVFGEVTSEVRDALDYQVGQVGSVDHGCGAQSAADGEVETGVMRCPEPRNPHPAAGCYGGASSDFSQNEPERRL